LFKAHLPSSQCDSSVLTAELASDENVIRHHHGDNIAQTNLDLGFPPEDWRENTLPWLFKTLEDNSTRDCDNKITTRVQLFGLPRPSAKAPVTLTTGTVHELLLVSYTESGVRRCSGGDFYETDITGMQFQTHF